MNFLFFYAGTKNSNASMKPYALYHAYHKDLVNLNKYSQITLFFQLQSIASTANMKLSSKKYSKLFEIWYFKENNIMYSLPSWTYTKAFFKDLKNFLEDAEKNVFCFSQLYANKIPTLSHPSRLAILNLFAKYQLK